MDELRMAVADDEPVLLAEVAAELARGIPGYPSLESATAGGWFKQVELEELPELAAFARYKGELGGGPERNNGEAAVLAWVSVNGGIAIIDVATAPRARWPWRPVPAQAHPPGRGAGSPRPRRLRPSRPRCANPTGIQVFAILGA